MTKTKLSTLVLIPIFFTLMITTFVSCDPEEEVDYTALEATLGDAQQLYDSSVEGLLAGQYPEGSRATLKSGIDVAEDIRNLDGVTQTEVDNGTTVLQSVIDAFKLLEIAQIQADKLVAYYTFTGNANDESGNGFDGVPMAGHIYFGAGDPPSLTTDRYGNANGAYHFDRGGNIEVPYNAALNPEEMTITLWCKKSSSEKLKTILLALNRSNGYQLQVMSNNKIYSTFRCLDNGQYVFNDDDSGTGYLTNDEWTHVAVSYQDQEMRFYINGVLTNTVGGVNGAIAPADGIALSIGSDLPTGTYQESEGDFYVGWGGYFKGDIDDIRIYNQVLPAADVQAIFTMESY